MVEHSPVISANEFKLLRSNLARTYIGIAQGIPGTEIVSSNGFEAAINEFAHPICNFVVCEDSDALDLHQLRQLSVSRKYLNVYVPHFKADDFAHRTLESGGFRRLYTLMQMMWSGEAISGDSLALVETEERRQEVAEFMADQFFSAQAAEIRDRIALATQHAPEFELYEILAQASPETVGAVLLHPTEGVLGLYNLCVAYGARSKGFGSTIVADVKAIASHRGRLLGLQCDPKLQRWYQHLGLVRVGSIDVYGFDRG
jgi:hypothetical protein